jgi:uncharacterized lipoprotein YmbA
MAVAAAAVCLSACGSGRRAVTTPRVAPPASAQAQATPAAAGDTRADVSGAERAALAFAQLAPRLLNSGAADAAVLSAIRAVASTGGAAHLVDETAQALSQLHAGGATQVRMWLAPLALQGGVVDAQATVVLWCSRVTEIVGGSTGADWITETWRLLWQDGAWHVDDEAETAGPQPGPGLDALLSGFHPIGATDG